MSRRRKTRFEKWFSLTRYRRRFGARTLAADLPVDDLDAIKHHTVRGDEAQYAYGSLPDLAAHLQRLRRIAALRSLGKFLLEHRVDHEQLVRRLLDRILDMLVLIERTLQRRGGRSGVGRLGHGRG